MENVEREFKNFIGIDVSKDTLDLSLCTGGKIQVHHKVDNKRAAIKKHLEKLCKDYSLDKAETLLVVEYTGMYNAHLYGVASEAGFNLSAVPGLEIKLSQGMAKGKNDKVDSARIARYGHDKRDVLAPTVLPEGKLAEVKEVLSARRLLVKQRKAVMTRLQESKGFLDKDTWRATSRVLLKNVKVLDASINKLEAQVKELLAKDEDLDAKNKLVQSVPGIGLITAAHILVYTCAFKKIKTPREFASYAGVAPFGRQSGTSIKGKPKVSNMANKTMKTLLHLCAMTARSCDEEIKAFYERKIAEGKEKMLVMNAVRNKLIHRVFACVNQGRPYFKNYYPSTS